MLKTSKTKKIKIGWIIVVIVVMAIAVRQFLPLQRFSLHQEVIVVEGDTLHTIYDQYLSKSQSRSIRLYLKTQTKGSTLLLQPGKYVYSGSYTPEGFVEVLMAGPVIEYEDVKILEGWSIYDIDQFLASQNLAHEGDYIAYVTDQDSIATIASKYNFVQEFVDTKPSAGLPISLEGLLYPDTYRIDLSKNTVYQLVALQLRAFQQKVYDTYYGDIYGFSDALRASGYSFDLRRYNIVTLASIIEKEEHRNANKPTIASIFLNRIQNNMRIDADITLCYGLGTSYKKCTPSVIVQHLKDTGNLYNTRVHSGLTPGPIANPSQQTFDSLLHFSSSDYLYYLHDSSGQIYYGKTLEEHTANKAYL